MSHPRYLWRKLAPQQREELLAWRKENGRPWHSPPHLPNFGNLHFLISAACYEHAPHLGLSLDRMDRFASALLGTVDQYGTRTAAWCVLPNHYHLLVEAPDILRLVHGIGRLHGRTSYLWNSEESRRGRQVFHGCTERFMRSERHFWATVNYIHHNPVHHGYVGRSTDWQWSSATEYVEDIGFDEARRIWREYPIGDYGRGWDDASL